MKVKSKFSLVDYLGVRYANRKLMFELMVFFTVTILTIAICDSPFLTKHFFWDNELAARWLFLISLLYKYLESFEKINKSLSNSSRY